MVSNLPQALGYELYTMKDTVEPATELQARYCDRFTSLAKDADSSYS